VGKEGGEEAIAQERGKEESASLKEGSRVCSHVVMIMSCAAQLRVVMFMFMSCSA